MAEMPTDTTCAIHPDRHATARCPSCRQFFCGECITEHEGRLTCAACLSRQHEPEPDAGRRRVNVPVAAFLQLVIAAAVCWLIFHFIAGTLADLPDAFHDGAIWE